MQVAATLAALLALVSVIPARGQSTSSDNHTVASAEPAATAGQLSIHSRAGEVSAPIVVHDRRTGEVVLDLDASDFHVFDNGIEQKINHFGLGDEPLSIVLLVETSARIEPILPAVRAAGIVFTETVMRKNSEAAVLGYDDDVNMIKPFTKDLDGIEDTIKHLGVGTSGNRLYDAMTRGVSLLKNRPAERRRILMIIGEAEDADSAVELDSVVRMAEVLNVTIYCVKLSTAAAMFRQPVSQYRPPQVGPPGTYPQPLIDMKPPSPAMQIASQPNMNLGAPLVWIVKAAKNAMGSNPFVLASAATGGLVINIAHDRAIPQAIDDIGGELHGGYSVGYRPPNNGPVGYHSIKVIVDRKGVNVRTRPGYYVAPPAQ